MRAVPVLLAVLAGCTALFGLREAESVDRDSDGILDAFDNCPDVPNPDQSDFDGDGRGDRCDECEDGGDVDADMDGIPDGCDGCVGNLQDVDRDGIDDNCDRCVGTGMDVDKDGIDDACDPCVSETGVDRDKDGIDDGCDQCIESGVDADNDMIDDACDPCVSADPTDLDADGIEDACDPCVADFPGDTCGVCQDCQTCLAGTGFDEDGDTWDDGCDLCKLVPSDPVDLDDDGVGVACEVGTTHTESEIFDGFNAENPTWYVQGALWTIKGGAASVVTPLYSYWMFGTSVRTFIVRADVRITGPTATTAKQIFGVIAASQQIQPAPTSVTCAFYPGDSGMSAQLRLEVTQNGTQLQQAEDVSPGPGRYQITLVGNGETVKCTLHSIGAGPALFAPELTAAQPQIAGSWFGGITAIGAMKVYGYSLIANAGVSSP